MSSRDHSRQQLRDAGLRATGQRILVLELVNDRRHVTVDEVTQAAASTGVSLNLSTAYRTLESLNEAGLVTHAHLGSGSPTYHALDKDPHIHLVCRNCGGVSSLPAVTVRSAIDEVQDRVGFSVDLRHLVLHGMCDKCAEPPLTREG